MKSSKICLSGVNLHYSSIAFKPRSIKSKIASLFHNQNVVADIHALKNINVTINNGERVGLIGHNGAGKSSLLKTIAGLYPVSSGLREVSGLVRSLFDLSLGFEPDATGRENILYRGLLLGLKPGEIKKIEEAVISFADIGEFIDYPIKTYSAGMLVRLAFSISTSVGGDILLLDEVIGAGDANFMKKARSRINSLIDSAEIIVLASHDLSTLQSICNRGLVISRGEIKFDGGIDDAVSYYKKNFEI